MPPERQEATTNALLQDPQPWSFSLGELTAGLRRHTGDPKLQVLAIDSYDIPLKRPSIGRIRGLKVRCQGGERTFTIPLVLKEPIGTTRTGMAGVGLREVSVYEFLADQLPVRVPEFLAAHPMGDWMLLKLLPSGRDPHHWQADDYRLAIDQMIALHDRFWGLGSDLMIYNWLSQPLESDFKIYVTAAAKGVKAIVEDPQSPLVRHDSSLPGLFGRIVVHADHLAATLREAPATLIHGDYWPGNLHITPDGDLTVYDWQQAGIGPGVLDLVTFVQASLWWFDPLPLPAEEIIGRYRYGLAAATGQRWSEEAWEHLWECALLWTFAAHWVDLVAAIPASLIETRYQQFEAIWLEPLRTAAAHHLPPENT